METPETMTTWNTMQARRLKQDILGTDQSESYPFRQDYTTKAPVKLTSFQQNSVIVDSQSARDETQCRHSSNSQDHVLPLLKPSKSSPIPYFEKGKTYSSKMWNSFNGPNDFGDTQPVDTQTFVADSDITTSRIDEGTSGYDPPPTEDIEEGPNRTAVIDLMGNIEDAELEADYKNLSDVSSQADELTTIFKVPKTPAMNGRKRNAREVVDSEARTSATKTPGFALPMVGMFGGGAHNVQLSQLFETTQAASSPLANAPKSDPVFDRPSPKIDFRHSSPAPKQFTTPIRPLTSDGFTSGSIPSDPLDTYVPMNESQEERERRLRQEAQMAGSWEHDEFEKPMSGPWHQQQKKIHQNALTSAVELTAPKRKRSSGPGRPRKIARCRSATDIGSAPRSRKGRGSALRLDATKLSFSVQRVLLPQESSVEEMEMDELAIETRTRSLSQEPVNETLVPETSPTRRFISQRNPRCVRSPSPIRFSASAQEMIDLPVTTHKTMVVVDSQAEHLEVVEKETEVTRPTIKTFSSTVSSQVRISQTQSQYSSSRSGTKASSNEELMGIIDVASLSRPPSPSQPEDSFPSSPPMLPVAGSEDEDDDELNDEEVDLIGVEAGVIFSVAQLPQTMADTEQDVNGIDAEPLHASHPSKRGSQTMEKSKTTETIVDEEQAASATAKSHLTQAIENRARNLEPVTDLGRPQVGKIRKFGELIVGVEPHNSIDSVDTNFNILTEGDEEFHNIMSTNSPIRSKKRCKGYGRSTLHEPAKLANVPNSDISQDIVNTTIQSSLKKRADVYDAPESTPTRDQGAKSTPQSTKKREQDGANAASHARQAILTNKNTSSLKRKPVSRLTKSSKVIASTKTNATLSNRPRPRSLKVLEFAGTPLLSSGASNRSNASNQTSVAPEPPLLNLKQRMSEAAVQDNHAKNTVSAMTVQEPFPRRVLAMFRGNMNYYTATVLGPVQIDGVKYKVRYDDRNEDILDPVQIRKLDLRLGDRVKVELPKMKAKTYIVVGFSNKVEPGSEIEPSENGLGPIPDVHGHLNVQLRVKGRESLPTLDAASTEVLDVAIQYIYLPRTMISTFADRKYVDAHVSFGRLTTPSNITSAPSTPGSRSRRHPATVTSMSSAVSSTLETGIFFNMAFAVTFSNSHNKEKEATLNLLQTHGARLIDVGFDQLFDLDPYGAPTPRKASPKKLHPTSPVSSDSLCLTRDAKNLGFTALIADRYCRRAKYVQALALSIPCLHYRWAADSLAASMVLPFQRYLLPAGESAFLFGAVRSRSLLPYDPASEDAKLKNIMSRRNLLLGGKSVLVVKGKGKTEEKRRIYLFLTYALGAAEVARVKDLAEAKAELESRPWDWVYVDGEAEEARKFLFGKVNGKKRKRENVIANTLPDGKEVKVVGDEFVIQSLILGALMGE